MEAMDPLGVLAAGLWDRQLIPHVDALDHEDADLYRTRLQRAGEGAGQSARGRGDDIVERGRVGRKAGAGHAVVLGHLVVDAELDRFALTGKVGQPARTAEALDAHPGGVKDLGQGGENL